MYLLLKEYKKIIILISSILVLSLMIIVGLKILVDKTNKYTVILDNLSISYPMAFTISDIYSNNDIAPYIQTSNSSCKSFLNYKCTEEGFEFSYPSAFEINPLSFPGSEILCHVDFNNKDNKSKNGFVQVWNLPYSLEEFLENSKKNSMVDFIDFNSKKININNLNGYFWEYSFNSPSGKFKSLEVFLLKNSKLYRVSYFMPLNEYNTDEYDMFWDIVKSLKTK